MEDTIQADCPFCKKPIKLVCKNCLKRFDVICKICRDAWTKGHHATKWCLPVCLGCGVKSRKLVCLSCKKNVREITDEQHKARVAELPSPKKPPHMSKDEFLAALKPWDPKPDEAEIAWEVYSEAVKRNRTISVQHALRRARDRNKAWDRTTQMLVAYGAPKERPNRDALDGAWRAFGPKRDPWKK